MKKKKTWVRYDMCETFVQILEGSNAPIIIYDTETTGLSKNDVIVQISAVKLEKPAGEKNYRQTASLNQYLKPPFPMPKAASDVNHITDEMLKDAPTEQEFFPELKRFFGSVEGTGQSIISGYNVKFDNGKMDDLYLRCSGTHFNPDRVVDCMTMAQELIERDELPQKSYNLTDTATMYSISEEGMHDSMTDVSVTLQLMFCLGYDYYKNVRTGFIREINSDKPQINIVRMYPYKVSKTSNMVIMQCNASVNGQMEKGRIHYDLYNHRFVQDDGNLMDTCNMYRFSVAADRLAGGSIRKYKPKNIKKNSNKKESRENG